MFSLSFILFGIFCMFNQTVILPEVTSPETTAGVIQIQNSGVSNSSRTVRSTTSCILPPYPDHGTYDVLNVNNTQPGQSYDTLLLSVRCERGYGMKNSDTPYGNSSLVLCDQGVWYETIPKCIQFCKLDQDPSVDYLCLSPGDRFVKSCHGYIAPGTTVSPVCKSPDYYSDSEIIFDMECSRGRWNYVAKCKPVCGRVVEKDAEGLVVGGTYTSHGLVPWHVGLYKKTENYAQICGGSIVTSKVVITAAHCFASRNASDYAVAGGKIYRPWNVEGDVNAQKSDVKEIVIPTLYLSEVGRFGLDIAALILVTPFNLNPFVRPVCLSFGDTFDKWQLRHGNLGKVAGWGLTAANGHASEILKVVDFPVISEDSCLNTIPEHFRPYITGDKFCAGYTNGTALCIGDSGGGLAFPDKEQGEHRFYLRGVVSTAARSENNNICNHLTYTAFTRVAKFQDFIKSSIASSERNTCQNADCDEDCVDGSSECKSVTSIGNTQTCQDGDCDGDCADFSSECRPVTSTEKIILKPVYEPCEWKGIKGECVPANICLTTLDEKSEKHPACSDKGGQLNYICCTDCQLVNDTSNFVLSPEAKVFWKDGRKARDACIQYMKDSPHQCYQDGQRTGINRSLDKNNSCHSFQLWQQGGNGRSSGSNNAIVAMLRTGQTLKTTKPTHLLDAATAIISEKFTLGTAYYLSKKLGSWKYAVVGLRGDRRTTTIYNEDQKTHLLKKIHIHPGYDGVRKYYDIALVELETPLTFSMDVLPACLPGPVEEFDITTAKYVPWEEGEIEEVSAEECSASLTQNVDKHALPQKINADLQQCYKITDLSGRDRFWFIESNAITVPSQFSGCMKTVIGLVSYRTYHGMDVFTKVKYFVPWIESIVWPS